MSQIQTTMHKPNLIKTHELEKKNKIIKHYDYLSFSSKHSQCVWQEGDVEGGREVSGFQDRF